MRKNKVSKLHRHILFTVGIQNNTYEEAYLYTCMGNVKGPLYMAHRCNSPKAVPVGGGVVWYTCGCTRDKEYVIRKGLEG